MRPRAILASACSCILIQAAAAVPGGGGSGSSGAPELSCPVRLTQTNNGNLLVSDHCGQQIVELRKRDLGVVRSFSVSGKPLAIAQENGHVYVGNETTGRVEVYDRKGRFLFDLGGSEGQFVQPTDMAIDPDAGRVFVLDGQQGIVKVFDITTDPTGSLVQTIPPSGPDASLLAHPTGIALDVDQGEVLVSDFGIPEEQVHPRVQIFDYAGVLLATISGKAGMMGQRFSRPQGLAVDGSGHIFVVASWLGRVIVLDRNDGAQVGSLGTYGTDPGELALPLDVVIDRQSKDVLVTNNRPGRIEVFEKGAVLP